MTNSEYEAACVCTANASAKFEGEHLLEQCDKAIAVLEESLDRLQAERREIVNRYDLNKNCDHRTVDFDVNGIITCRICGAEFT